MIERESLPQLAEAVQVWTGWGLETWPHRDDSRVTRHFGLELGARLLPVIKSLEDDFYRSEARFSADGLAEMGSMAIRDFKRAHPELPDQIAEAFAWCYTFDFK